MSAIIFAGHRTEQPDKPWICCLCSQCGCLERREIGQAPPQPSCECVDDNIAVIGLIGVTDEDQVWRTLTDAAVDDHVIGRVLRIMHGQE